MNLRSVSVGRRRRGRHAIPRVREKILTSALELFAQNGFEMVTGDQLAAGARVGKGSVYRLFGSKEGLYAATVLVGFRQLRHQIECAIEEEHSFPERIATIRAAHTVLRLGPRGFLRSDTRPWSYLAGCRSPPSSARIQSARATHQPSVEGGLGCGMDSQ
jgi:AcrR family transcriptional regulator